MWNTLSNISLLLVMLTGIHSFILFFYSLSENVEEIMNFFLQKLLTFYLLPVPSHGGKVQKCNVHILSIPI